MTFKAPRPVLTFVVGVSGHRPPKLSSDATDFVEKRLLSLFAAIDRACAAEFERARDLYQHDPSSAQSGGREKPPHRVRLLSGFAEGADQIAARLAPAHWEVEAILPYPREAYERNYAPGESSDHSDRRGEFRQSLQLAGDRIVELPEKPARELAGHAPPAKSAASAAAQAAYARQGAFMLRQIDLLAAVWNGLESDLKGGTGDVIEKALENAIPVVWISSQTDRAPWLLSEPDDRARETEPADALDGPLQDLIAKVARAPKPTEAWPVADDFPAEERLRAFFAEHCRTSCNWVIYDCLKRGWRFWTWRGKIPMNKRVDEEARWSKFLDRAPEGGGYRERLKAILLPRFLAADVLASYYSHAYRSAYVLAYLLSTLAVAVTLIGTLPFIPHEGRSALLFKAILVLIELCLIWGVISLVRNGRRNHWHGRWMDYRALAEQLRHLRFLALAGETKALRGFTPSSGAAWVSWYLQATIRELGLPHAMLDQGFQRKALIAARDIELKEQLDFHRTNSSDLTHLNHRLHFWGEACFKATFAILLVFFAVWLLDAIAFRASRNLTDLLGLGGAAAAASIQSAIGSIDTCLYFWLDKTRPFLVFFTALLPVLGAAIAGIRFTGDFEGFAGRSRQTAVGLEQLDADFANAIDRVDLDLTAETLIAAARVMTEDLSGWHSLYALKRLTLPA